MSSPSSTASRRFSLVPASFHWYPQNQTNLPSRAQTAPFRKLYLHGLALKAPLQWEVRSGLGSLTGSRWVVSHWFPPCTRDHTSVNSDHVTVSAYALVAALITFTQQEDKVHPAQCEYSQVSHTMRSVSTHKYPTPSATQWQK